MKQGKFNLWVGALLLLGMLATCYAAIDTVYHTKTQPQFPSGYAAAVLRPCAD